MEIAVANELNVIEQAQADPALFADIYDHYYARVYNFVRYRVHDPMVADDLTAEVFTAAFDKLASYRAEKAPFAAWLFAIARNTVNSYFRRRRYRQWLGLDAAGNQASMTPGPDEQLSSRQQLADLLDSFQQLDSREQEIMSLKFAADLTNRDIAAMMNLTESNVGIIVYRAVRRLRAIMTDKE